VVDNVSITSGSGTDISTDDAGAGGHVQRVKLAYSADGVATHISADADGLLVNLGTNNDVTVTGTVTVGSITAGDNNIGNVDVVTLPNVTLAAGTNTNEVVGDIAHDTGVSGNPVLIAGAAQNTDDTAPPNRVSAESDTHAWQLTLTDQYLSVPTARRSGRIMSMVPPR
jgi:hypothetical protein